MLGRLGLLAGTVFVVIGVSISPGGFFIAALLYVAAFRNWVGITAGDRMRSSGAGLGTGERLQLTLSRQKRHEQWQAAGQRLGLTFSEVSRRAVLAGFVQGVEVEMKVVIVGGGGMEGGAAYTFYQAGRLDEEEADRLSEREANALRMRLHTSPTVK